MKCNICEQEMVKGYIPAIKWKLMWLPQEVKVNLFGWSTPKGGISLSKTPVFGIPKATSYHCTRCNVIITPITTTEL